jgi:hypothetical protein
MTWKKYWVRWTSGRALRVKNMQKQFLETWPPIYRGQERPARDRLRLSQVHHHVYSQYMPCFTNLYLRVHPTPYSPDPKSFILDICRVNSRHIWKAPWCIVVAGILTWWHTNMGCSGPSGPMAWANNQPGSPPPPAWASSTSRRKASGLTMTLTTRVG